MTREKEIEKAAFNYINSDVVSAENMQLAFGDFIEGAKWADKTMIDKACEWLKSNMYEGTCEQISSKKPYPFMRDFIEEFRQAMKGE